MAEVLFMFVQLYRASHDDQLSDFKKIHVLYTTFGISVVAFNVNLVYRDPAGIQAIVNNLVRLSSRFYGNNLTILTIRSECR